MQEKERFERYTPKFPLPSDIASMSRQDTVCQFCGVSYLIHNEIKALEAKCQQLESDLAFYTGMHSREAALEKSLQTERTHVADLESTVAINTHKLNEMARKVQLATDQLQESVSTHRETKGKYSANLRGMQHQVQMIRKEHLLTKDFYSKEIQNWKIYFQTTESTLQKEIQTILQKHSKQTNDYQQQLNETNQNLRDLQVKYQQTQEFHTKIQNDLEIARKETQIHQSELSRLRQQLTQTEQTHIQLKTDFEHAKNQCREFEQQISSKDELKTNVDLLLDQYRQQLTNEKELRTKNESELETLRSKHLQLTNDYQQLNTWKKELETNELNTRKKLDETNRSRQAVLDRTRDEYEKLLGKYNELDEVYRNVVTLREQDAAELQTLRRELERLHQENIELTKQKETMNITHDIQMKKVQDGYSIRLKEAEQWPDRLQMELKREREQQRIQMEELEHRLKENFTTELNIEKQKTNGLLRKYEQESDHSTQKLRHELVSSEKLTLEQRQSYEKQIEQLQQEKNTLKKELDTLRTVLKELHEQINNQGSIENDRRTNLQLKEDLLAKESSLFQAQSTISGLRKEVEQAREDMLTLQETVHKECAEREQLKDALIEARQQLLAMKKNGVLNGTGSRSLHSPPVAFEEIERRVSGPLPLSHTHTRSQQFSTNIPPKHPPSVQSDTRDGSLPGDTADLMARPLSSSHTVPYRHKPLPPIHPQPQQQRRNGSVPSSNKSEELMANQRRIARFIKHIK